MIYIAHYDELLNKQWKQRPDATKPGKIEHSGKPLDFSFLKLQDVQSLRKERPRDGTRKPIEKDEEEEDAKQGENINAINGDEKLDGDRPKETKESMVIRNTSVP